MMDYVVKILTVACIVVVVVTLEVMAFSIAKTIVDTSDENIEKKIKERIGESEDSKNSNDNN